MVAIERFKVGGIRRKVEIRTPWVASKDCPTWHVHKCERRGRKIPPRRLWMDIALGLGFFFVSFLPVEKPQVLL